MARLITDRSAAAPPSVEGPWPLAEPFRIADVVIPNRVIQAPLAGIANWAFRGQSRRHGAGMAVSEMVSSMGIIHGNDRTDAMYETSRDDTPVAIQLFGADPTAMADAARAVAVPLHLHAPAAVVIGSCANDAAASSVARVRNAASSSGMPLPTSSAAASGLRSSATATLAPFDSIRR